MNRRDKTALLALVVLVLAGIALYDLARPRTASAPSYPLDTDPQEE